MTDSCPGRRRFGFRFGVIGEQMTTSHCWREQARRSEALGFATLLVRDHVVPDLFGDQFAPLTALMAAADATTTLRIGNLVIDNDYRHPVILAKEAATLDLLSDGRFELGLGATFIIADDRRAATERLIRERQWAEIMVEDVWDMPSIFVGSLDQIARDMHERRDRLGFSYFTIPSAEMAATAPIVARMAGR